MARSPLAAALPIAADNTNPLVAQAPTLADGWQYNAKAYADWVEQQRQWGVAQGMLDPATGWPTKAALIDAAQQYGSAMIANTSAPSMRMSPGFMHAVGTKTATGEPASAYMNPSRSDIARMLEATPGLHLRALQEGPNHAIWPALDATHGQMAAPLGFTKDAALLDYRGRVGEPDADFPQKAGRFSFWAASH